MKFIKLTVKNHTIMHGFDGNGKEVLEKCIVATPTIKLISIDRIKSLSKDKVLTDCADGRWIFWEYEENFEDIQNKLLNAGLLV